MEPSVQSPEPASRPRLRRDAFQKSVPRLLFEGSLIVFSVLLAFSLGRWQEGRSDAERGAVAVEGCVREITANLARLERTLPAHRTIQSDLARLAADSTTLTVIETFTHAIPAEGLQLPALEDTAWETAVSTGATRLMTYEDASALSRAYLAQRGGIAETVRRINDAFFDHRTLDPDERDPSLRLLQMLLGELASQEDYLIGLYRDALADLSAR